MHIERTRHVDASERNADGSYEYYYEHDIYRFIQDDICFVARSYTDMQQEAHFLRIGEDGVVRLLVDADLTHSLFLAKSHLLEAGKTQLQWLSGRGDGYGPIRACFDGAHARRTCDP